MEINTRTRVVSAQAFFQCVAFNSPLTRIVKISIPRYHNGIMYNGIIQLQETARVYMYRVLIVRQSINTRTRVVSAQAFFSVLLLILL